MDLHGQFVAGSVSKVNEQRAGRTVSIEIPRATHDPAADRLEVS